MRLPRNPFREPEHFVDPWSELAAYNTRVAQGVVHTPDYVKRMAAQQATFAREQERDLRTRGFEERDGYWIGPARA